MGRVVVRGRIVGVVYVGRVGKGLSIILVGSGGDIVSRVWVVWTGEGWWELPIYYGCYDSVVVVNAVY